METPCLVPLWQMKANTETGERISDGVQSQATTCWIYSQGTTANHVYVKHTWGFQQANLHCATAHADQLIYILK